MGVLNDVNNTINNADAVVDLIGSLYLKYRLTNVDACIDGGWTSYNNSYGFWGKFVKNKFPDVAGPDVIEHANAFTYHRIKDTTPIDYNDIYEIIKFVNAITKEPLFESFVDKQFNLDNYNAIEHYDMEYWLRCNVEHIDNFKNFKVVVSKLFANCITITIDHYKPGYTYYIDDGTGADHKMFKMPERHQLTLSFVLRRSEDIKEFEW